MSPTPLLPSTLNFKKEDLTVQWHARFSNSINTIHRDDPALIFALSPEKLVDRDYGFNEDTLSRFIARIFQMPLADYGRWRSWPKLASYRTEARGASGSVVNTLVRNDLGSRVERIMREMGRDTVQEVHLLHKKITVEEVDNALIIIAANNEESSEAIKSLARSHDRNVFTRPLERLYLKLGSNQAKWLTRLLLKDYGFKVPTVFNVGSQHTSFSSALKVTAEVDWNNIIPIRREGSNIMKPILFQQTTKAVEASSNLKTKATPSRGVVSRSNVEQPLSQSKPLLIEAAPSSVNAQIVARHTPRQNTELGASSTTSKRPLSEITSSSLNSQGGGRYSPRKKSSSSLGRLPDNTGSSSRASPLNTGEPPRQSSSTASDLSPRKTETNSSRQRSTPRNQQSPTAKPSKSISSSITKGTGTCKISSKTCPFTNCIFILSPAVTSIRHLIKPHGTTYTTSLQALVRKVLPRRCSETGRKVRKIALVESKKRDETIAFMHEIEGLGLKRSSGEREYVEVYDWRLLEKIAAEEAGNGVGWNVWKRYWVGAA
ncbi:hypothetical protein CJF31_00009475 [Rutstroemia sp. NJR-2017a BVV2]|nr:hypothetical protein CJF31_00009475 [Rutstroemia sp. NJR-2017a BVV2]